MKLVMSVLCAAAVLAPSVQAQVSLENSFGRLSAQIVQDGPKPLPPLEAARAVIAAALETMRTRYEVAPRLFQSLRAAGGSVDARLGQAELCVLTEKTAEGVASPLILCSEAIGKKPRDYAVFYISEQIGRLVAAGMPECVEKDYMAVSLAARSWIEVGGQLMADRAAADRLQEWWGAFGMATFVARREAFGQPSLAGLLAANLRAQKAPGRSPAELAKLQAEEKSLRDFQAQAAAFASDEADWLKKWNTLDPL
ncbi:MAG: hypothetical protein HY926_06255 [Elusimicrobia bacterium]|nr:hypothetical protein [Elusimicrobiota bacterium]